jgi:hypothetical protein
VGQSAPALLLTLPLIAADALQGQVRVSSLLVKRMVVVMHVGQYQSPTPIETL